MFSLFSQKLSFFSRRRIAVLATVLAVIFVFLIPRPAWATLGQAIAQIIGNVVFCFVQFVVGNLLAFLISALQKVAEYNDFINSAAVSKGWIITRDVFNMFFVIVLLVIAFSAVLKSEKYAYKRLLPSFLIAAVLVNFSKLICGIFIDFSQILMLTFISAIKDVAEGNLIKMLGLGSLLTISKGDADQLPGAGVILGAVLLGLIMSIVAVIVVGTMVIILVFRIVMIWFLVVLSPLAFMAGILPSTESYGRQWWEKFTHQLIVGPVMAFFLWLSLAVVQENAVGIISSDNIKAWDKELDSAYSEMGKPQYILNFVIGIVMLIVSLMSAQQLGVAGSSLAGKAIGKMQGWAQGVGKLGLKGVDRTVEKTTKGLGRFAGKIAPESAFGQAMQKFQGISYDITKEAWKKRKADKASRRAEVVEEGSGQMATAIDKAMDPGWYVKKTTDFFRSSKLKDAKKNKDAADKDIENKDEAIEKEQMNIDELKKRDAEGQEARDLINQIQQLGLPLAQLANSFLNGDLRTEKLRESLKNIAKEMGGKETDVFSRAGLNKIKTYLKQKSATIQAQGNQKKIAQSQAEITRLEKEKKPSEDISRRASEEISNLRYETGRLVKGLGLAEKRRTQWVELAARRRQAERQQDLKLTTGGDEGLLVEEMKQAISTKDSDKMIAAAELLTQVNGWNTALLDPMIQGHVKDIINKDKAIGNKAGALADFEKNPVSAPAMQMLLRNMFEDIAHLNKFEMARAMTRVSNLASLSGNHSLTGMAYIDSLTGEAKLGGIKQDKDGKLEVDEKWAKMIDIRAHQVEPQQFMRTVHADTFVTEDQNGQGSRLHDGGKKYLSNVTAADIAQISRMRPDTMARMCSDRVILDIEDYAQKVKTGGVLGVNASQGDMILAFARELNRQKATIPRSTP